MTDELIKRLKEAAQAATPQNLDTAQTVERYEDGSHITCPTCDGEGYAELNSDFCNYDGKAIGVQFYGIGPEHLAAEAYFRAASPAAILDLIALIEQQAAALEAANARIAELEAERDALANSLAAAKQDASTAWERHAMANRIGNAAADELATARGRIAELEVQLVNANDAWLSLSQAAPQPLEAQADARWQPIETAPKDGTEVLLIATLYSMLMPYPERIVGAYRNGWWSGPATLSHVTHWQPLPAAPAALSQKAGEQQ